MTQKKDGRSEFFATSMRSVRCGGYFDVDVPLLDADGLDQRRVFLTPLPKKSKNPAQTRVIVGGPGPVRSNLTVQNSRFGDVSQDVL